jgi:hypothetical protein
MFQIETPKVYLKQPVSWMQTRYGCRQKGLAKLLLVFPLPHETKVLLTGDRIRVNFFPPFNECVEKERRWTGVYRKKKELKRAYVQHVPSKWSEKKSVSSPLHKVSYGEGRWISRVARFASQFGDVCCQTHDSQENPYVPRRQLLWFNLLLFPHRESLLPVLNWFSIDLVSFICSGMRLRLEG